MGELSRKEIETRLATVGDYVKMDYLQKCLKEQLDFDTKRFVLTTLAKIYESRKMYLEAGKLIRIAADINTTFEGKMNDFLRSAELLVKGGNFNEADVSVAKAVGVANDQQKVAIKITMKNIYKAQAKEYLSRDRRKHALDTYEKLLSFNLDPLEKKEVQQHLLQLYEKLGRVKEYFALERVL